MTTKKRTQDIDTLDVEVVKKPRRKTPAHAFQPGNPYAFKPGFDSRRAAGGRARTTDKLLSKSLRIALADIAPKSVCTSVGLDWPSSWSQCIAQRLLIAAAKGSLEAAQLVHKFSESHADVRNWQDLLRTDPTQIAPIYRIEFVETDGDGRPRKLPPPVIDASTTTQEPSAES